MYHVPSESRVINGARALKAWARPTLLSKNPTPDEIEPLGAFIVSVQPVPEVSDMQVAVPDEMPDHVDGVSTLGWTVRAKTPEEIEGEKTERRASLAVERWQFAIACMQAGIITPQEAEDWAPGNSLPAIVQTALQAALANPGQRAAAKVKALSVARIRRENDLITILGAALNLTEDQIDSLFVAAAALD